MVLFTDINPFLMALAVVPVGIVASLIGLGGSLLGGLFNRESRESKEAKRAQTTLARQQAKLAKGRGQRETSFFDTAQPLIGTLIPQLQALLSGDREQLTQRFAPSLERLTSQRQGAQQRIEQAGPASGATAQASIELEKAAFGEQNRLLSSAPAEAQAGLTQLLQLLLGAGTQAGQGSTAAANVSAGANQSIIQGDALGRAANQGFFDSLVQGASTFGRSLFKPKQPFVPAPTGSLESLTGGFPPAPAFNAPAPNFSFNNLNTPRRGQ